MPGRSAAAAVATVRRRTNLVFGEPSDADVVAMLNDGLEAVARELDPVLTSGVIAISVADTQEFSAPADCERLLEVTYSFTDPSVPGTVVYPVEMLDYSVFQDETNASATGAVGGIPDILTLVSDSNGQMTYQFYPYASTGQFNLEYSKRPAQYQVDANGNALATSFTDLDSLWQEAVIVYACMQACENREDLQAGAARFEKMYATLVEKNKLEQKRRERVRGSRQVNDVVDNGDSVVPDWVGG